MFTYNAELIRVIDGDTVDVKIDLGFDVYINTRVRLLGIDTPETRTKDLVEKRRGMEAKKFVENAFEKNGNKCVVQTLKDKKGKFGRYLATIIIQGESLNQLLIENNHEK